MPSLPGIPHQRAVRAFQKAGFWMTREGKHIIMTNGREVIAIPRQNPINALTMGGLVVDAGLTLDEFRKLL